VIAMENHNWTQPANRFGPGTQQIYQNPNAPFINSLVNGTAFAQINGSAVNISLHWLAQLEPLVRFAYHAGTFPRGPISGRCSERA
jgi:hypothetical protein